MEVFGEENFFGERPAKVTHFVYDHDRGKEIDLSQEGDVHGITAGSRIRYTDKCYELLKGREATVLGFSDDKTWTQLDDYNGVLSTLNKFVPEHLELIADPEEK